jgi:hypothetical protein
VSTILTLRPRVGCADAIRALSGGMPGMFKGVWQGPLRSVAEIYIPYRLFRVEIRDRRKLERRWLALDAVRGTFDPYRFDPEPDASDLVAVETRNHPAAVLAPEEARLLLLEKVRRVVFGQGFFKLRQPEFHAEPSGVEFHIPYWAGFRGRHSRAHLSVLDAVRGCPEGAKMRAFLTEWMSADSGDAS